MREYDSVEPSWKMTTENFEDMDSDVELEEYVFDSDLVQTMSTLAMLRYDKEGEKKLKGPTKCCGGSVTSNWRRSAVRLKEYYEDVIFPKRTGQLGRPTIGLTTCIRYLREWGFDKRYYQQDVYYDGQEREDVVAYRKDWASKMMQFRTQMKDFDGEICDKIIMPVLQPGQVEIVLVTYDKCYFNSNDDVKTPWTAEDERTIKKKGQGTGLMVSDFYCPCHGSLQLESAKVRIIKEPRKNRHGYWKSDDLVRQLEMAVEVFEKFHPCCVALFCFDQSSNHQALPDDALTIQKLALSDRPAKAIIRPGRFLCDGRIVEPASICPDDYLIVCNRGMRKGKLYIQTTIHLPASEE
ncbi:hypothetical protein V1520DRAFT_365226 [Lipomyces starkeyi]